jgi:hypothetical protein
MFYSISVRHPVGLSWEGEAPASPSGVWMIMRLLAGLVPRPPGGPDHFRIDPKMKCLIRYRKEFICTMN